MALGSMGNDILDKVGDFGKDLSWLTTTAAFVVGVDQKEINSNGGIANYFPKGGGLIAVKDLLGHFGIAGVTLPGNSASINNFGPNIGAFFNKALLFAVLIKVAKEVHPSKLTRMLDNVAFKPLVAYSVGRIFDDPIASSQSLTGFQNSAYPVSNYTNQSRNGMPLSAGEPWGSRGNTPAIWSS